MLWTRDTPLFPLHPILSDVLYIPLAFRWLFGHDTWQSWDVTYASCISVIFCMLYISDILHSVYQWHFTSCISVTFCILYISDISIGCLFSMPVIFSLLYITYPLNHFVKKWNRFLSHLNYFYSYLDVCIILFICGNPSFREPTKLFSWL